VSAIMASLATYMHTVALLIRGGVRPGSIVFYPIGRRWNGTNRLKLRNGITLVAPREEPLLSLFEEVWVKRYYAPPGYTIAAGEVIIDIGAHVGTFTVWAASANRQARVIAVEPFGPNLRYLRQNVAANRLANVTILEACCGGTEGTVELQARGPAARNTIYCSDNYGSIFRAIAQVHVVTLDRIFSEQGIEHCDLLKLDCEGAEYDILYAASETTLARIRRIAMEYHVGMNQHRPELLAAKLEQCGFTVDLHPPMDEEGGYMLASRK